MKRIISAILILGVILIFACAPTLQRIPSPPQEVNLNIKTSQGEIEKDEEPDKIRRSMTVPNPEGSLSGLSFLCKGKGYATLWGGLTSYDAKNIWNDIVIMTAVHQITEIHLFINSPGGDAFSGLALADEITRAQNNGCKIIAHASGLVASAAVPIFAVCSERIAGEGTIFMVHEASVWKLFAQEQAKDLKAQVAMIEILEKKYIGQLVKHSKLSFDEWYNKQIQISYFTAEQAKEWGLVDRIE